MPLNRYDKYFGGRGSAAKTLAQMKRTYGPKDGEHVFWGKIAKLKRRPKPTGGKR